MALVLIIALALGINALTLLFLGSAVVALERFARAARRLRSVALFGALWSGVLGAGAVYWSSSEIGAVPLDQKLVVWASSSAVSLLLVAVMSGLTHVVLRSVSPARLGLVALIALGLGTAAVLGVSWTQFRFMPSQTHESR